MRRLHRQSVKKKVFYLEKGKNLNKSSFAVFISLYRGTL